MRAFLIMSMSLTSIVSQVFGYNFEGAYDVNGAGPHGNYRPYHGTLMIEKDVNGVYQATWDLVKDQGICTYIGTGIPICEDAISFIFADILEKKDIGIIVYHFNDQEISGIFTHLNNNLIGKETIYKRPDNESLN